MKIASQKSDSGSEKIEYEPEIFKMDKAVITVNDDKKLPFKPLKSKKGKSKTLKCSSRFKASMKEHGYNGKHR